MELNISDTDQYPRLVKIDTQNIIKKRIIYFYFNLTRKTENTHITDLSNELDDIMSIIIRERTGLEKNEKRVWNEYLCGLYKLIGQTRDMVYGKGERDLTYMMLVVWYKYFPVLAIYALRLVTQNVSGSGLFSSYGSWSDIKYFCGYFMKDDVVVIDTNKKQELLNTVIGLMNVQIDQDRRNWNTHMEKYLADRSLNPMTLTQRPYGREIMSLACKWVPREKSKYGWLYDRCVVEWFRNISPQLLTDDGNSILPKHETNCKMKYRKMISILNREIGTVQIKQCNGQWSDIDPDSVPMVTLIKQRNAFCSNKNKKNTENRDRKECSETFIQYYNEDYQDRKTERNVLQRCDINIGELVKVGLKLCENGVENGMEKWVNKKWDSLVKSFDKYEKNVYMIPIVDICWEVDEVSRNKMIGIAILLSQHSVGHFIISGEKPQVISTEKTETLVEILQKIHYLLNHLTVSDLERTYNLIYNGVMSVPFAKNDDISGFTFVLLSDFNSNKKYTKLYNNLSDYKWCGIDPYFVYWNIGGKNFTYTDLEKDDMELDGKNKTIVSGDSMGLFDYFFKYGIYGVKNISSYEYLGELLNHPRYKKMGEFAHDFFTSA
jgi:hypothetical protein